MASIIYNVQVLDGPSHVTFERRINASVIPTSETLIDFTPLDQKSDPRLLFRVMGVKLNHSAPGQEERVRVSLAEAYSTNPRLLEEHNFIRVPSE